MKGTFEVTGYTEVRKFSFSSRCSNAPNYGHKHLKVFFGPNDKLNGLTQLSIDGTVKIVAICWVRAPHSFTWYCGRGCELRTRKHLHNDRFAQLFYGPDDRFEVCFALCIFRHTFSMLSLNFFSLEFNAEKCFSDSKNAASWVVMVLRVTGSTRPYTQCKFCLFVTNRGRGLSAVLVTHP